jgi:hypothetical protein
MPNTTVEAIFCWSYGDSAGHWQTDYVELPDYTGDPQDVNALHVALNEWVNADPTRAEFGGGHLAYIGLYAIPTDDDLDMVDEPELIA